jgi:hypothetical protein
MFGIQWRGYNVFVTFACQSIALAHMEALYEANETVCLFEIGSEALGMTQDQR